MPEFEAAADWWFFVPESTRGTSDAGNPQEHFEKCHVCWMMDQGLLEHTGPAIFRLDAAGAGFLDLIRENGVWKQARDAVSETEGNAAVEQMKNLGNVFIIRKLEQHTGLDL